MAADATLVQAARLEALSKVPRIDKDLAKRQAGITTTIIEGAQAIVTAKNLENKIKNEADKLLREGQIAEFQTLADDVNKRLATYDKGGREAGMHEQIYNNTYDHIATLKAEYEKYNTIGDDDTSENRKKRVEIMAQMEQIKNSIVGLRGTVQAIGAGFGTDAIDPTGFNKTITDLDMKIGGEIINMDGDYSNVTQRWDTDTNQIFFDVVVDGETHTWSATDLKNKFPSLEGANNLSSSLTENSTTTLDGIKKAKLGDKFNLQGNVDDIVEVLGTYQKSDVSHVFQTKQPGVDASGWVIPEGGSVKWEKGSWANALEANSDLNGSYSLSSDAKAEVVGDLIAKGLLDMDDVDGGDGSTPDNKISAEELEAVMTAENRDLVISALVDSNNPLYDHELSKREYAIWRANQNKGLHDDEQTKKQEEEDKNKPRVEEKQFQVAPNTYMYPSQIRSNIKNIKSPQEGDSIIKNGQGAQPVKGIEYKFEFHDGGWLAYTPQDDGTFKSRKVSENYVIRQQGYGAWGSGNTAIPGQNDGDDNPTGIITEEEWNSHGGKDPKDHIEWESYEAYVKGRTENPFQIYDPTKKDE